MADIKVPHPSMCNSKTSLTHFIKVKNDACMGFVVVASFVGAIVCAPCGHGWDVWYHRSRRGHGRHRQHALALLARACCSGRLAGVADERV